MAVNIVERIDNNIKIKHVLVSVSDKKGLDSIIPMLVEINPQMTIYSTGGTYKAIQEMLGPEKSKKNLMQVSDYTGQPEMQGGLVKTLDFKIYLGILSETYNEHHAADLKRTKAWPIDMVIVNLYPFKATIAQKDATPENARANIDIGGPCMVRAAAKNYLRVASVTDPADYAKIIAEMKRNDGCIPLSMRLDLAKKAFAHTGEYDAAIAKYFADKKITEIKRCYKIQK